MSNGFDAQWGEYDRTRKLLAGLLLGWVPFGFLVGYLLPKLFGTYVPTYVAAAVYGFGLMIIPCPNCGNSLKGRQLYRRTCPTCGVSINS